MQVNDIYEPGNESPGLLGVKAPVLTPCSFGPNGTRSQEQCLKKEPENNEPIHQLIQFFFTWQNIFPPSLPNENEDRPTKRNRKRAIRNNSRHHMDSQPGGLECRHERTNGRIERQGVHGGQKVERERE